MGPGDVAIRDLLAGAGPFFAVLALLRFVLPPLAFGSGAPGGILHDGPGGGGIGGRTVRRR